MKQSSTYSKTGSSWLHNLILLGALAGAMIQIHIAFPGGSFDGRFYIPREPLIEWLAPDDNRFPIPVPAPQHAGRPGHQRPP
jgi:hypothetical protein